MQEAITEAGTSPRLSFLADKKPAKPLTRITERTLRKIKRPESRIGDWVGWIFSGVIGSGGLSGGSHS
jgi:hypothetical protein